MSSRGLRPFAVKITVGLLCFSPFPRLHALDREAFTFTDYKLQIRMEPARQFLGANGTITLRNNSNAPQRIAVLQISSTLQWKSITQEKRLVQYLTQTFTSDIDHTGTLSEAVVTLLRPIPPKGTAELQIAYEGVIPQDSTRLERIGTPKNIAAANDWDRISEAFTAVRGVGYVEWYPVAMEAASLSAGSQFSEILGRWKLRHMATSMSVDFYALTKLEVYATGTASLLNVLESGPMPFHAMASYSWVRFGLDVPAFAIGAYRRMDRPGSLVRYLNDHEPAASDYARVAANVGWVATHSSRRFEIVELPDIDIVPYNDGPVLLTPLKTADVSDLELTVAYARQHADVNSSRLWIYEGLAAAAKAVQRERQAGREAAISLMGQQRTALVQSETMNLKNFQATTQPANLSDAATSLVGATDDSFARAKGMYVWWMLRDMLGDRTLQTAFLKYRPADDKEPSYVQRLLETEARITAPQETNLLEQFFDDWVYRDRGLPDFRIVSVYPRQMLESGFLVTVTVENLGGSGAEVPVTAFAKDENATRRLWVPANQRATVRIPLRSRPTEARVNDGSVPETDMMNNSYKGKLEGSP